MTAAWCWILAAATKPLTTGNAICFFVLGFFLCFRIFVCFGFVGGVFFCWFWRDFICLVWVFWYFFHEENKLSVTSCVPNQLCPLQLSSLCFKSRVACVNCYRVTTQSGPKIEVILLSGVFQLSFLLTENQSHLLFSHYFYSSWTYVCIYIWFIYCCLHMESLRFSENWCHKALGWTVLRKDCSHEDLLLNLKPQLCRKISAFLDLVLVIKQEAEVASIQCVRVGNDWDLLCLLIRNSTESISN